MDGLWDRFWDEMSREWFKLEVRQDYSAEDNSPSLRAWLKGDQQRSIDLLTDDDDPEFTSDCRQKLSQGVKLLRIHVIERPLSAYMEWELEYYSRLSVPYRGENVFIVERDNVAHLDLPDGDLIMFDGRRAILNTYGKNGLLESADFYNERDNLGRLLRLRKAIMEQAKPLPV